MLYRTVAVLGLAGVVLAQPASDHKHPEPAGGVAVQPGAVRRSAEHVLLGELAGEFDVRVLVYPMPTGTPEGAAVSGPVETTATAKRVLLLGGLFLEETLDAPGDGAGGAGGGIGAFSLRTTIGFNPDASESRRFELVRLSSHSPAMMTEAGSFDRSTKLFTFRGQYTTAGGEKGQVVRTRTVLQVTSAESATIDVYTAIDPIAGVDPKKDPAEPDAKAVPEYKAYSLEYTKKR